MLDNFPGVQILTRPLPYNLLSAPHQVRFYFRILLLTYNAINGLVPFYLQDLINLEAHKYKFMLRLCPNHARNFYKKSSEKFFDVIFHKKYLPIISQSFPKLLITGHGTKNVLPKEILNPEDCDIPMYAITTLIIYMKKLLDSDWLRTVQFFLNTVPKR